MANVRFNLYRSKPPYQQIVLVFRYDGQRLFYYTGERIKPAWWNAAEQRVRKTPELQGWQDLNEDLKRLADGCLAIYQRARLKGEALPPEALRLELDVLWKNRTRPVEAPKASGLVDFFEALIAERRSSPNFAFNTVKAYGTALMRLRKFAEATHYRLDFDTVTLEFHGRLVGYLAASGLAPNSIHKTVAVLKAVMAEAADRALHTNYAFRSRRFSVRQEETDQIHLTESELERMAALDLSARPGHQLARDLFLVGAATGLRYSDYEKLTPENRVEENGVEVYSFVMQKTRRRVAVPVLPLLRSVLDRYPDGRLPAPSPNQVMNRYLKEIGRLAGIDTVVPVQRGRGVLRVESSAPKWQLIATHAARRSFATNEGTRALEEGRALHPIMAIMGIRTEAVFVARYLKISAVKSAALFAGQRAKGRKAG